MVILQKIKGIGCRYDGCSLMLSWRWYLRNKIITVPIIIAWMLLFWLPPAVVLQCFFCFVSPSLCRHAGVESDWNVFLCFCSPSSIVSSAHPLLLTFFCCYLSSSSSFFLPIYFHLHFHNTISNGIFFFLKKSISKSLGICLCQLWDWPFCVLAFGKWLTLIG